MPRKAKPQATPEPSSEPNPGRAVPTMPEIQEGIFEEEPEEKPDFWLFMQQTSPAEWDRENYSVYLYRADGGDARRPRGQRYLELICRPFTIEDIRARYGGGSCTCSGEPHGHYRYMMTGKGGRLIYSGEFAVEGRSKIVGDPAPASAPPSDPLVREELARLRHALSQEPHSDAKPDLSSIAVSKMIDMIGKTPNMAEMFAMMNNMRNAGAPESLPKVVETLKELGVINVDPLEKLGSMVTALEMLGIRIKDGGGSAAPISAWANVASQIVPQLAKAAESVSASIAAARHEQRLALEAQIRASRGEAPAAAGPQTPAEISAPPAAAPTANGEPTDVWIRTKIADQIKRDRAGDELGDWIDQISPEIIERLRPLSADQVIEWMTADPILSSAASHPRLRQTVTELLEYANSLADA